MFQLGTVDIELVLLVPDSMGYAAKWIDSQSRRQMGAKYVYSGRSLSIERATQLSMLSLSLNPFIWLPSLCSPPSDKK